MGLAASFNRPGGNLTGVSTLTGTLVAKQFEVMHETIPKTALIGFLINPNNPDADNETKIALAAAGSVGQQVAIVQARGESELEAAFATLAERGAGALVICADPFINDRSDKLAELTTRQKLPAIHSNREFTAAGGLMSYGNDISEALRLAGHYAGQILKGGKPADLRPVQQSVKVQLAVNLQDGQDSRCRGAAADRRPGRRGDRISGTRRPSVARGDPCVASHPIFCDAQQHPHERCAKSGFLDLRSGE